MRRLVPRAVQSHQMAGVQAALETRHLRRAVTCARRGQSQLGQAPYKWSESTHFSKGYRPPEEKRQIEDVTAFQPSQNGFDQGPHALPWPILVVRYPRWPKLCDSVLSVPSPRLRPLRLRRPLPSARTRAVYRESRGHRKVKRCLCTAQVIVESDAQQRSPSCCGDIAVLTPCVEATGSC